MKKSLIPLVFTFIISSSLTLQALPCRIVKEKKGEWHLEIDNVPFELKGIGCSHWKGKDGTNYFTLAKEAGVNTVRTWGTTQGTKEYLDQALLYGLNVDAGIWLPHCNKMRKEKVFSYLNNPEKLIKIEEETLNYIKNFKDHPAILMWNLGNETLFFTNEETEKIAFCKFLARLVTKVKKTDPDHPVLYTCAGTSEFKYIKKYVKNLDLLGVNSYGGIEGIYNTWKDLGFKIPFMLTEAGPLGPWDCPKDEFGKSVDQADYEKSFSFQLFFEEYQKYRKSCIGIFPFLLGDTTQESLSWWNITLGKNKRESFHVIKKFYTGKLPDNTPPLCTELSLDKTSASPGELLTLIYTTRDKENDPLQYGLEVSTSIENVLEHTVNIVVPVEKIINGPTVQFKAPDNPGIYKLHFYVLDGKDNAAVRTLSFEVIQPVHDINETPEKE